MTPLRDAAESAMAGVPVVAYRTDIFENLPNGKLSRLILEAGEVIEPDPDWTPLVALTAVQERIAVLEGVVTQALSACLSDGDDAAGINAAVFDILSQAEATTLSPAVKEPK